MNLMEFLPDGERFKHVAGTSGGEWAGPCPGCGGKDRFRVWPAHPRGAGRGGRYYCRDCEKQGDGIQFLRDFVGTTYREACKTLQIVPKERCRAAPTRTVRETWMPKPVSLPGDPWQAAAVRFARCCIQFMAMSREGQAYATSRGLNQETCQRLGVGWNLVDRREPLSVWGLPEEVSPETGRPRTVWLPAGLVVPTTRNEVVTAIKIRRTVWTPEDPFAKYLAVRGGSQSPFVLNAALGKPVVVVESELDAVLISQEAGDLVTAIALGTARGKPDDTATAIMKAAPVILNALDFDEAGKAAWPWWKDNFPASVPWPVPFGKDVGDLMNEPGMVRVWIEAGLSEAAPAEPEPVRVQETQEPSPLPGIFAQWQTPAGQRFILPEPPFSPETLASWEVAYRTRQEFERPWPVMPPGMAWAALRAIEDAHAIQGFYVKPQWRGLSIPLCWPSNVGLSLQSLYLAATYGPEVM